RKGEPCWRKWAPRNDREAHNVFKNAVEFVLGPLDLTREHGEYSRSLRHLLEPGDLSCDAPVEPDPCSPDLRQTDRAECQRHKEQGTAGVQRELDLHREKQE